MLQKSEYKNWLSKYCHCEACPSPKQSWLPVQSELPPFDFAQDRLRRKASPLRNDISRYKLFSPQNKSIAQQLVSQLAIRKQAVAQLIGNHIVNTTIVIPEWFYRGSRSMAYLANRLSTRVKTTLPKLQRRELLLALTLPCLPHRPSGSPIEPFGDDKESSEVFGSMNPLREVHS